MFEYIGHWGPPPGDPPPHHGYPYDGDTPRRRQVVERADRDDDYTGS